MKFLFHGFLLLAIAHACAILYILVKPYIARSNPSPGHRFHSRKKKQLKFADVVPDPEDDDEKKKKSNRKRFLGFLGVILVGAIICYFWFDWGGGKPPPVPPPVTPDPGPTYDWDAATRAMIQRIDSDFMNLNQQVSSTNISAPADSPIYIENLAEYESFVENFEKKIEMLKPHYSPHGSISHINEFRFHAAIDHLLDFKTTTSIMDRNSPAYHDTLRAFVDSVYTQSTNTYLQDVLDGKIPGQPFKKQSQ